MAARELLCHWFGIDLSKLSKYEIYLVEGDLLFRICGELKKMFITENKEYFDIMRFSKKIENDMLQSNFVGLIINDILSTEEYTIEGIACYSDTPEDVVQEVTAGRNNRPSATMLCRIIELHRSVRPDLYQSIIKKIFLEYSRAEDCEKKK